MTADRVLITGGAGFSGSWNLAHLAAKQIQATRRIARQLAAGGKTEENKMLEISPPEEDGREESLDIQTGRIARNQLGGHNERSAH